MHRPRYRLFFSGLLIGMLALLWPFRIAVNAAFWDRALDAAHLPLFAAATWLCAVSNPLGLVGKRTRIAAASVLALIAAASVEIIQPLTGREESLTDLRDGAFGIALAAAFLWPAPRRHAIARWLVNCAAAFGLMAVSLWPVRDPARGIWWRRAHFPLLADFESGAEMQNWWPAEIGEPEFDHLSMGRVRAWPAHGEHSISVWIAAGDWPGMTWRAGGQDWRGYRTLAFEIFNPLPAFDLSLRIDDDFTPATRGTQFHRELKIQRGWNSIRIPLAEIERGPELRPLNLGAIRKVTFFRDHPKQWVYFHFDYMRLEK